RGRGRGLPPPVRRRLRGPGACHQGRQRPAARTRVRVAGAAAGALPGQRGSGKAMNKRALVPALTLVAGVAIGYGAARLGTAPPPQADAREDWVARVAGEYISKDRFVDEMRQRGGLGPGQYQQPEQRRALLDALVYQQALVAAARNAGIDRLPEVERTLDQVLANQVLQRQLRDRQQAIEVPEAAVRAFYEANVADYTVPA